MKSKIINYIRSGYPGLYLVSPEEQRVNAEMKTIAQDLKYNLVLWSAVDGLVDTSKGTTKSMETEQRDKVIDAASGLTTIEAENAFALSVVENKNIDPAIVTREKAQAVKKNGILEIIETKESLESIGGLDVLKEWLLKRRNAFSQRAIEYGLPTPKGLLIIGIPGTGKSLTAKATAKVFGVPLLKLDAGRIFAGLVGQSESNLRAVIQTAEAIAPCCLWIDEIEKGFSGTKSSNATDGGTSSRVFGSFISWMQEKKAPVFVVATANDVSQLPPEMLRKGRFDEIFKVETAGRARRCLRKWASGAGRTPGPPCFQARLDDIRLIASKQSAGTHLSAMTQNSLQGGRPVYSTSISKL